MSASSGETPKATIDNTAIELLPADSTQRYRHVRITNGGALPGFYSLDGGTTFHRLEGSIIITDDEVSVDNQAVQAKREFDGPNITGLFASAWAGQEK